MSGENNRAKMNELIHNNGRSSFKKSKNSVWESDSENQFWTFLKCPFSKRGD
jgi:hypothetical protein